MKQIIILTVLISLAVYAINTAADKQEKIGIARTLECSGLTGYARCVCESEHR